jgi:hypothetical protein
MCGGAGEGKVIKATVFIKTKTITMKGTTMKTNTTSNSRSEPAQGSKLNSTFNSTLTTVKYLLGIIHRPLRKRNLKALAVGLVTLSVGGRRRRQQSCSPTLISEGTKDSRFFKEPLMCKSIAGLIVAAFAAVAFSGTQLMATPTQLTAMWAQISNVPAGTPYQIIFATAGTVSATDANIADYNIFVQAQAQLNTGPPDQLPATTWDAVVSTQGGPDAATNAPSPSGSTPDWVINTEGDIVSKTGLYHENLNAAIESDQYGLTAATDSVWTGSFYDGTAFAGYELGDSPEAVIGQKTSAVLDYWVTENMEPVTDHLSVYALSPEFNVPEPTSFTLIGLAAACALARRRQQPCPPSSI